MLKTVSRPTKYNHEILSLRNEVRALRSLVIGIVGNDKEGEYRSEFVKKILKASKEKPTYHFKDQKSFLAELRK